MNIDIANMAVNLSEKAQEINFVDAGVTLFAVFLGAHLAYWYSQRKERQKDKKQEVESYSKISNQIALSLNSLCVYKEIYLDEIKKAFEENNYLGALKTSYKPDSYFMFDVNECCFLNSYNRCFPTEFALLTKVTATVFCVLDDYYKSIYDIRYAYISKDKSFESGYENLKKSFQFLYDDFEHLIARFYYLNKELIKGYEKYFNIHYYEGLVENYELEAKLDKYIHDEKNKQFIAEREKQFDEYWCLPPNIYCVVCLWKRKLMHKIRFACKYFKKPQICNKCRCCFNKKEKH